MGLLLAGVLSHGEVFLRRFVPSVLSWDVTPEPSLFRSFLAVMLVSTLKSRLGSKQGTIVKRSSAMYPPILVHPYTDLYAGFVLFSHL